MATAKKKKKEEPWMKRYLAHLVGKKIVSVDASDDEDEFPSFTLDDGSKIEISRDPEGNGPGFLFGLPDPQ